jgi:pyruvate kinase
MQYELIATLGPASEDPAVWKNMIKTGISAFRLNTSHMSPRELDQWLDKLVPVLASQDRSISLILDLQGSKWRLGECKTRMTLVGEQIELTMSSTSDHPRQISVPHADFFKAAPLSDGRILLNDARVELSIDSISEQTIQTRVIKAGPLSSHKGITFSDSTFRREELNVKDQKIVQETRRIPGIRYALSYVRDGAEMKRYREALGEEIYLIAKLERRPALQSVSAISDASDELWLCRGDLGAELGLANMAAEVSMFSRQVESMPLPVILAGQVLEHMTSHPTPTRSELCYLYDALCNGYTGIVLSDETAIGDDPLLCCQFATLFLNR